MDRSPEPTARALTLAEKQQRQRMHVRRSYYRKLDKMSAMRERVEELKREYLRALESKDAELQAASSSSDDNNGSDSASTALAPTHKRATELYMRVARAKEALLAENAALQQMLEGREAISYRVSQLLLEMNDECKSTAPPHRQSKRASRRLVHSDPAAAADAATSRYVSVEAPVTPHECDAINRRTFAEIRRFLESHAFETTGASVFGWRDRRRVEGERLKFSLQKTFAATTALDLSRRSWAIVANATEHRSLHSTTLNAQLYCAQRVHDDAVVLYRVFLSEDGRYAAKSLFLVSRFAIANGFVVLLRSIEKERLRRTWYIDGDGDGDYDNDEDAPPDVPLENEQWIDVFSWLIFEHVATADGSDACRLDFGGDVRSTGVASSTLWMLEVLLIALRWESKVNGSLFKLTSS